MLLWTHRNWLFARGCWLCFYQILWSFLYFIWLWFWGMFDFPEFHQIIEHSFDFSTDFFFIEACLTIIVWPFGLFKVAVYKTGIEVSNVSKTQSRRRQSPDVLKDKIGLKTEFESLFKGHHRKVFCPFVKFIDGVEQRRRGLELDWWVVCVYSFFKGIGIHRMDLFSDGTQVQSRPSQHPFHSQQLVVILNQYISMKNIQVALHIAESRLMESFEDNDCYFFRGVQTAPAQFLNQTDC